MILEIIITLLIVVAVGFILYRSIKNKASGQCDCGCGGGSKNCSHCIVNSTITKK